MAIIVTPEDREKIKDAVQKCMELEGIAGEVALDFNDEYNPPSPLPGGEEDCRSEFIGGRWVTRCPKKKKKT